MNGTVDPNSFTYNGETGDLNFNISNYADGSGMSASVDLASPTSASSSQNVQGLQILGAADRVGNAMGAVLMTGLSIAMPEILADTAMEGGLAGATTVGGTAGLTEHAAQRLAERGISPEQAQAAIKAAKQAGNVVSKIGKYGTPQSVYTANGIRVVVEEAGANAGKIITAFYK